MFRNTYLWGEISNMEIWQIGNNGMRNANRLQAGLLAYAEYPQIGHLGNNRGSDTNKKEEIAFTEYLNEKKIITADLTSNDGTHARKWRYVAQKMGFIFPPVPKGHDQSELGSINTFTPSGKAFLACKSRAAIYDCFLRAQIVSTEKSLYKKGAYFSPIRYTAAIMLELEKLTGSSSVNQLCFDTCIQTSDPTICPTDVASKIVHLTEELNKAPSKKVFKKNYIEKLDYSKQHANFQDYGNTNRRYFILTGLFEKDGNGIVIAEGKHYLVEQIAYGGFAPDEQDEFSNKLKSCNIPSLPTDSCDIAIKYYRDVAQLAKSYHILIEKSVDQLKSCSAHDINVARYNLEDRIFEAKENKYALKQQGESEEIDAYLSLIQDTKKTTTAISGKEIKIPKDERPAYLEWIAWRAFLAIDHMVNSAAQARHFNIDSSFLPTGTASGGDCDVLVECQDTIFVVEVTLTTGSRQESAETESVRRHVSDIMRSRPDKEVVGVFIANTVASETYNTFKNESYIFDDDYECSPHIVPFTIEQFRTVFCYLFREGNKHANPRNFVSVYKRLDKNKSNFRTWREHIEREINTLGLSM